MLVVDTSAVLVVVVDLVADKDCELLGSSLLERVRDAECTCEGVLDSGRIPEGVTDGELVRDRTLDGDFVLVDVCEFDAVCANDLLGVGARLSENDIVIVNDGVGSRSLLGTQTFMAWCPSRDNDVVRALETVSIRTVVRCH